MQHQLDIALVAALVLSAMLTVLSSRLLRSVIGLAVTSGVLAVILFRLQCPIAAVIELSVCAGLIPAIFIAAVTMTARLSNEAATERWREQSKTIWTLPLLVLVITIILQAWSIPSNIIVGNGLPDDVRNVLWGMRHVDLLGQITVLMAAAFAVVVLVKEAKEVRS